MLRQNPENCRMPRITHRIYSKTTNDHIVALVTHFSVSLRLPGDKENLYLQPFWQQ